MVKTAKNVTADDQSPRHGTALMVLVSLAIFTVTLLYIATGSIIQTKGQELAAIEADIAALEAEKHQAAVNIATLSSPAHLAAVAAGLGMTRSVTEDYMYYLPDEGEQTVASDDSKATTDDDKSMTVKEKQEKDEDEEETAPRLISVIRDGLADR